MREDEIRDLFREMRDEPVPADSLARMRAGLDGRITRWARWKVAGWLIAAAAIALIAVLFRPAAPVHEFRLAVAASHQPKPIPVAAPQSVVRRAVHRVHRTRRFSPAAAPVVIEIETADPEVVIRFIGD